MELLAGIGRLAIAALFSIVFAAADTLPTRRGEKRDLSAFMLRWTWACVGIVLTAVVFLLMDIWTMAWP